MRTILSNVGLTIWDVLRAVLSQLLNSLSANINFTIEALKTENDRRVYKAEFGNAGDIFDSQNAGFCLNGTDCISKHQSYQNLYLQGATGSGKTANIIIPSIYRMSDSSLIIHDPAGQGIDGTSGYNLSIGREIIVFDFSNPINSHSINPLDWISTQPEIQKFASLISGPLRSSKADPFWFIQTVSIISCLIGIVLTLPKQYRNMANVYHLLTSWQGNKLDAIFIKNADDKLFAEYKSLKAYDVKLQSNIVASAKAALQIFSNEDVAKVTSHSTFSFSLLRRKKCIVYLKNHTTESKYYAPLISMFFELLMQSLMKELPSKTDKDVFLLIDEASTLSMPSLSVFLTNSRKYRAGTMHCWQSQEQLVHLYGSYEAETIVNNSFTKIYLGGGQGLQTCKQLEQVLGKTELVDGKKKVIKPLMLSEDIRQMPVTESIIIQGALKPLKLTMTPYYKQSRLSRRLAQYKPVQIANSAVQSVPLYPIPRNESNEAK